MNQLKSVFHVSLRGYARKYGRRKPSNIPKSKENPEEDIKFLADDELYKDRHHANMDFEDEDDYDPDRFESDFSSVGRVYDAHEKEMMMNKEKLKMRIIARKYFKSEDPNFITWSERVQMRTLHNADSNEWTPERLSEAFPALPDTIKKLIKSAYSPKRAEDVIKYDQKVVANWEQFKKGSLALDPRLEAHLNNFKGRKIEIVDLKTAAEQFVKPKPYFPPPKSQIFTNIVKNYVEQPEHKERIVTKKLADKTAPESTETPELREVNPARRRGKSQDHKLTTFDEFVETRVNKMAGNSNLSLEEHLLVNEYKDRQSEIQKNISLDRNTKITEQKKESSSLAVADEAPAGKIEMLTNVLEENQLATGVIEWKKKEATTTDDYPRFIKIPHNKAATGVTFKVQDRYYDADGEFLYRVPGFQS